MTHEDPTITPYVEVPLGYEPVAEFGTDLSEAIQFYHGQGRCAILLVICPRERDYSIWVEVDPCWPILGPLPQK